MCELGFFLIFKERSFKRTTQQTFSAINLASQQKSNKALLFFSDKETIQTFNGSI